MLRAILVGLHGQIKKKLSLAVYKEMSNVKKSLKLKNKFSFSNNQKLKKNFFLPELVSGIFLLPTN